MRADCRADPSNQTGPPGCVREPQREELGLLHLESGPRSAGVAGWRWQSACCHRWPQQSLPLAYCSPHQSTDGLGCGHMLLSLRADGPVVDDRPAGNRVLTVVDQNGGVHKIAVRILMPNPHFGNLAGPAGYGILMTIDTRGRVEDRAQAGMDVFPLFKDLLIEGKSVTGRFGYSIADALRWRESWSMKPRRSFGGGLLCDSGNPDCQQRKQAQENVGHSVSHRRNLLYSLG